MSQTVIGLPTSGADTTKVFFLSQLLGARVLTSRRKVGRLTDLVIKETTALPVVTHLCVSLPFGESALVPWEKVASIESKEVVVDAPAIDPFKGEPPDGAVLLKDHILDKKAIDLEGRELQVVYDVRLVLRGRKLYVTDVDLSHYGLLRRMGLTKLADFIYSLADSIREQTVSWKYIQPLPAEIGRFRGNVQVSVDVLKERLEDLHPVDLADILEEMDPEQRLDLFDGLPIEQASDTLEEIEPNTQRDLISALEPERAAELIDEMSPAQAADVLAVLSTVEADPILDLMSPDTAEKVRAILDEHEEQVLNFATQDYIAFPISLTVAEARRDFRAAAKDKAVLYVYVVDGAVDRSGAADLNKVAARGGNGGRVEGANGDGGALDGKAGGIENGHGALVGVLDIRDLLIAEDETPLRDVMVENVVTIESEATLKDAAELFRRYGFRAIPIVDARRRIVGVLTYRDVMGLDHRFVE